MEKYKIKLIKEKPKYDQISNHIKKLIDKGEIENGEKLPSIRKLADFLSVNNDTIVKAYKKLENEGLAIQKIGSGTYAKMKDNSRKLRKEFSKTFKKLTPDKIKEYIDFTGEDACSEYFPIELFKDVLNEVLDRDGISALAYQEPLGYEGLRKCINDFFWNGVLDYDDILIVSGAQQGIDVVTKSIINVNDNVLIEKPTYSGALSVFKWRRANIMEVSMEKDGPNVEEMKKILKKEKIKCFYTMSYFQNPTGITCSLEKKKEIINLAEEYDFYIIEDDYLSELIYSEDIKYKTYKSLDIYNRVIYIKSFSKIFLPGIRIGYLISPTKFIYSIRNSKVNSDISTSSLMQRVLDLYIKKGVWKEYINKLNEIYLQKYLFMKEKIDIIFKDDIQYIDPKGGLNFYFKISSKCNINSQELFHKCKEKGILITPGVLFYKFPHEGKKFFKLGFSKTSFDEMERGILKIKDIINSYGK